MANTIQIIEKEPWFDNSMFTGNCYMYPTYMVKDVKEFFMFNRREPDGSWVLEEDERRKNHLLSTGGAYFRIHGFYDDPMEMLAKIVERKHHFESAPQKMFSCSIDKEGYVDFMGNRREVAAGFYYRIYDADLTEKIKAAVDRIIRGQWEVAM